MDHFRDILLNKEVDRSKVQIRNLRLNSDRKMCRMTTDKKSLSDIFVKMAVQSDKTTCLPLSVDGVIL